ncbi:general stress protein 26 [Caulobacter ginsengisoli]|uniref:General stress protein 26 n=1 Tax=Caulobacter ginsengisoli TaxID=400775 RepID=A0ABU0IVA4_9CAUL|nr:pyridoxamine 5'-phosphate oxidase family protein [Caulobacter ginsengisoli]MDQ0465935.1 general stress protein 26 [Caulobacter ginsengisoli]
MTTDTHDRAAVETRLWREIDKGRFGMLGLVEGPPQHFQPMTAFAEPDNGEIWFFTSATTDLARDAANGRQAMFVVQARDRELQACISGFLTLEQDKTRLDRYWSPMVAAWFPHGRDDPGIRLLKFACEDARVWISEQGPIRYAWELAKASATGKQPDMGGRTDLNLS